MSPGPQGPLPTEALSRGAQRRPAFGGGLVHAIASAPGARRRASGAKGSKGSGRLRQKQRGRGV